MPQPNRTNAEAFDSALVAPGHDVLADTERVVEQIEHAGDDIANKGLCAKTDRDTDDARAGNQWSDLHAHFRQRHHHSDRDDQKEQDVAKDRKEGMEPSSPPRLLGVRLTQVSSLDKLAIDRRFHGLPQDVGA